MGGLAMIEDVRYTSAVEARLRLWKEDNFGSRMWNKDPTLWSPDPNTKEITDRLGWLFLPESMQAQLGSIKEFAESVINEGFRHVVLLGMGGSSLAPAVFQDTFGNSQGYPELCVLDSTHPSAIKALTDRVEVLKTLFIVSSKSGTTLETLTLFSYFWDQVSKLSDKPGRNFVAITDPGTPLEQYSKERKFLRVFLAPPDVGGRYSVLTVFGLVPAALIGIDIDQLLFHARQMAEFCGSQVDPSQSPGTILGAVLGEHGIAGRDKITFVTDARLCAFPLWLEQLIAESLGKNGKGLVPVAGELPGPPEVYGQDRFFIGLSLAQAGSEKLEGLEALQSAGHPLLRITLRDLAELGQEFFRWEVATASAGAILGIHPFNQPDVQLAKDLARKAMESKEKGGKGPSDMLHAERRQQLSSQMERLLQTIRPGDYVAIQAYVPPEPKTDAALEKLRNSLRDRWHIATSVGYGPRFLHSTGQLHKGGPDTGIFIQLTDQIVDDLIVPEKEYTFGRLIGAQAEGDYQALKNRGRRVLRINLGDDVESGLGELAAILDAAV
jgi:transaldolase/glucose-6-phosphate isomerase